jgi:hypothetical protein
VPLKNEPDAYLLTLGCGALAPCLVWDVVVDEFGSGFIRPCGRRHTALA